jgi:hypothetical protein
MGERDLKMTGESPRTVEMMTEGGDKLRLNWRTRRIDIYCFEINER